MKEMKAKVGKFNGVDWYVVACLFANDTDFLGESERDLQRVVGQCDSMCSRRKLRMNAGKS